MATPNVDHTWLCSTVDHYGSTYGDKGWGCGYRNIQMMLSTLVHHTGYNSRLFNGQFAIPSVSKLQELIETAWKQGFDPPGCEQLGGRLTNTRKWIGATEVVTFLSSFHIRCHLVDCHQPTGPNGTHPEMFNWVKDYFLRDEELKPPIYLQHHGHSRTVIGLEELRDGNLQLLVFDPSHSKSQMEQFNSTASNANAMRLIRRPLSALKARQYQLVAVNGLVESEEEYQLLSGYHKALFLSAIATKVTKTDASQILLECANEGLCSLIIKMKLLPLDEHLTEDLRNINMSPSYMSGKQDTTFSTNPSM